MPLIDKVEKSWTVYEENRPKTIQHNPTRHSFSGKTGKTAHRATLPSSTRSEDPSDDTSTTATASTPTEPEDVDPNRSHSNAKSGTQYSKNDAPKEIPTSDHPGMMGEGMSILHDNASKEEKRRPQAPSLPAPTKTGKTFVRRPRATTSTGLSQGQAKPSDEQKPPARGMPPTPTENVPAAHTVKAKLHEHHLPGAAAPASTGCPPCSLARDRRPNILSSGCMASTQPKMQHGHLLPATLTSAHP